MPRRPVCVVPRDKAPTPVVTAFAPLLIAPHPDDEMLSSSPLWRILRSISPRMQCGKGLVLRHALAALASSSVYMTTILPGRGAHTLTTVTG